MDKVVSEGRNIETTSGIVTALKGKHRQKKAEIFHNKYRPGNQQACRNLQTEGRR